ncbi:MAG TPA: patatin-like phospholipase family protein [Pedobacter sp.]|jgi:hypothetical protein
MKETKDDTFRAGICMAGAVSAGAYTAGVMDYLLEALEHWERAKKLQQEGKLSGIPKHNFMIEVLGGASAGGMTAAITAAAVQENFAPVTQAAAKDNSVTAANPIYNSWVNLKEKSDGDGKLDMMDFMLATDDIENDSEHNSCREVRAGFNSVFVEELASAVLDKKYSSRYKRPYIAKDADIFTTITNLRGFSYKVTFQTSSGSREHRMKMHRDFAFFKLNHNENDLSEDTSSEASTATTSEELPNDGRIPVNFSTGLNTDVLKQAAMATGAFPVGLESRDLKRQREYIERNKYLNLILAGGSAEGVEYEFLPKGDFLSLNVDGGVINNEPYELTQQLLDDRRKSTEPSYETKTSASEFDSMVLMIDPFPNDEDVAEPEDFIPKKAWKNVVPAILSAMRGELMMKDEQVRRAYLSNDYTRFLLMPVREKEKFTIACGSLGGFGGFFSKDFRKHDFFLGRRNCQRFLQHHFTVPENAGNPILKFGYSDSTFGKQNSNGEMYLPILPDLRVEGDDTVGYRIAVPNEESIYPYPKIKLSYILGLEKKFKKRIKCVFDNIGNPKTDAAASEAEKSPIVRRLRKKSWLNKLTSPIKGKFTDLYLSIGKSFGKDMAAEFFIDAIITDMEKRGLLEDDKK